MLILSNDSLKANHPALVTLKIFDVYRHDAVSIRVAQSWFKRFQSRNFYVKDASCSDRSITGKAMEKVKQDQHIGSHDINKELNIDHKIVLNHLEKISYKKNDVWVPYDLTVKNLMDRILCESLLKRNKIKLLLKRLTMKNGSRTTIIYEKNRDRSKMKRRKR